MAATELKGCIREITRGKYKGELCMERSYAPGIDYCRHCLRRTDVIRRLTQQGFQFIKGTWVNPNDLDSSSSDAKPPPSSSSVPLTTAELLRLRYGQSNSKKILPPPTYDELYQDI